MTRSASLSSGLAALLVAVVLACAAGPAAAAVVGALEVPVHCEPTGPPASDESPSDAASCCLDAPDARRSAVAPASLRAAPVAALLAPAPPAAAPVISPPPLDAGPPPGPRLHLALSVLLV